MLLLMILLPQTGLCQRSVSAGVEVSGVYRKSANISPFDAYRLYGPLVQLTRQREGSRIAVNVQSGFSWVRSEQYNDVYSIPLNVGLAYQMQTQNVYGITASAGTRFMFSGDADQTKLLPSLKIGICYDLFKGMPFSVGYERAGKSDMVFARFMVTLLRYPKPASR